MSLIDLLFGFSARDCFFQALEQFHEYEHLYTQEQEQVITEFLSTNPHLSDVECEMEKYEELEEEIGNLVGQLCIGNTILLSTGKLGSIHKHL